MFWHLVLLDRDGEVNVVNGLALRELSWGPTALGICLVCNKTARLKYQQIKTIITVYLFVPVYIFIY